MAFCINHGNDKVVYLINDPRGIRKFSTFRESGFGWNINYCVLGIPGIVYGLRTMGFSEVGDNLRFLQGCNNFRIQTIRVTILMEDFEKFMRIGGTMV